MHRFSHLAFPSSPGPGPAFLGLLGRLASPQFLVEAEGDCSKSQVCSRGAVTTCTCPSDHEPFLAAGRMYVVLGLRNALSPEPHRKQPHSVSDVLRTETDGIQTTVGRGLGAGWLLRWSLLPPSGRTAHHLLLEASGSVLKWPLPWAARALGFHHEVGCVVLSVSLAWPAHTAFVLENVFIQRPWKRWELHGVKAGNEARYRYFSSPIQGEPCKAKHLSLTQDS